MNTPETTEPSFRDSLSTVDAQGKRVWVYPKKPQGKFYTARTWVSIGLLLILFGGPFVRINGEPLLLLNVLERKFVIFGQVFWPQDFYLFGLAMIMLVVFIILFTAVYGRLFCGWVCPQTIFLEMVFRKIEYWIEGDYTAQRALDRRDWDRDKIVKKTGKHLIFFALSFLIANTFLAYIIGSEALLEIVTDPPGEHLAGLVAILVFTGAFYFVFARLREQVCISICPYGRLQGVLLDRQSTVVAYDYRRGEPRGKYRKNEDRDAVGKGDCIECQQCVHVCPTGIDIRNGTQLECVNCTACIDACDAIMEKVDLPKGLIRYASEAGIAEGKEKHWTARNIAYTVVLVLLTAAMVTLLALRTDVETSILRTPGIMYQEQENNQISNLYNVKIINKTNEALSVHLRLINRPGTLRMVGQETLPVPRRGTAQGAMFVVFDRDDIKQMSIDVEVGVYVGDELLETVETSFLGPS
jgi:cytochrome c oxidase accessory protein FixG